MPGPGTLWGFEVSSPSSLQLPQQPRLPPRAPRKGRPCAVSELSYQQGRLLTQISCIPGRSSPLQTQIFQCTGCPCLESSFSERQSGLRAWPWRLECHAHGKLLCPLSQVWRGSSPPDGHIWGSAGDVLSCHPPKQLAGFHIGEAESSSIGHICAAGSRQGEKLPGWQGSALAAQVTPP